MKAIRPLILVASCLVHPSMAVSEPAKNELTTCDELRGVDLTQTEDAPTQIVSTQWIEATGSSPNICQVSGYVAPSVHFLLHLPADNWNGKFLEQGCGGFCGSTDFWITVCRDPVRRGYVCIVSDMGHNSEGTQAMWAHDNLQAKIDHAYRSAHVTALAGKAIVERYYNKPPKRSYFTGCSTGGRQALMEAQRFPWDFDGIIAASPSLVVTRQHMALLWANRALVGNNGNGQALLKQQDLDALHQAALDRCDLDDGVRDGVISDPRACDFNPVELRCRAGNEKGCLTDRQLETVNKIYGGPTTSTGMVIFPSGRALKGSERGWLTAFAGLYFFTGEQFRYIGFDLAPGPAWRPEQFDFDQDYKRLGSATGLFDADNPDLRSFKEAGGKLIVYTGLNDALGLALPPIDYYETVEKTMGGREATQQFFRLFALPGVGHCVGGDGAGLVDWLSYLEAWVEKNRAPDKLIAVHPKPGMHESMSWSSPKENEIEFSRPVYPYPIKAKYLGQGDPNNADSFGPVMQ